MKKKRKKTWTPEQEAHFAHTEALLNDAIRRLRIELTTGKRPPALVPFVREL